MKFNLSGVTKQTWIRLIVLLLVLVNFVSLSFFKHKLLPFTDDQINDYVTYGLTLVGTLWAGWKNNSLTLNAQDADAYLKNLNNGGK